MKTSLPLPILDLAQFDAAIFNLDEVILTPDRSQGRSSQEHRKRILSSAVAFLKEIRGHEIKIALVTAAQNGKEILITAGLGEIVDQTVDGKDACQLHLHEKPEPDRLLKAADLLEVLPGRIAIFETTWEGVQAGRAGNFGVIVDFHPLVSPETIKNEGATLIVPDLLKLTIKLRNGLLKRNTWALPSGLEHCQGIFNEIHDKSVVVFLDYDGTLTPIVDRPELATLSEHTKETLRQLAKHCTVGVISGRDRVNVQQLVNVDSLIYAGSHGFDISGPKNWKMQHEMGAQFVPVLDQVEATLHEKLDSIVGTLIERKKFSVAVHYRLVGSNDLEAVRSAVAEVISQHPEIRTIHGKKIYDLQPRIDWDKGKALIWLLKALKVPRDQAVTFFFGDDVTDEDAFRVLQDNDISIIVEDTPRYTYATYRLNNPDEVDQFLRSLIDFLRNGDIVQRGRTRGR